MSDSNKRARSEEGKGGDDWKQQPPYVRNEENKDKKAVFKGSCHCKDVTFDVFTKEPKASHFCHCDTCQKLHGSATHWSAVMPKTDVHFTCAPEKLAFYRTEDQTNVHELPCKLTCARCHSPIADEGRNMILMYPSTFDFEKKEDRQPLLPDKHIFYSMRSIDIEDGMDKWEGMQDDSKKMDEEHHHGQKGVAGSGSKK